MRVRIVRDVEGTRLPDFLPPPLRRRLPAALLRGGPYTLLLFPSREIPVKASAVSKGLARLGDTREQPVVAFAPQFTLDAAAVLAEAGVEAVGATDARWTEESFEEIRTIIASPRKSPLHRRPPDAPPAG